jgi:hypothetical protein
MRVEIFLLPLLLVGCANVSTTRFVFKSADRSFEIEMPKEVDAKDLSIKIDPVTGALVIDVKNWSSRNVETIEAQANRESDNIKASSEIVEKAAEGAMKGAVKAIIPIP